jgi:hypothetical protein
MFHALADLYVGVRETPLVVQKRLMYFKNCTSNKKRVKRVQGRPVVFRGPV